VKKFLFAAAPFFWGVSNSSFQVEGNPQPSDWSLFAKPGTADRVTSFYEKYDRDFGLAQELGANAFRLSVAWERIEPAPGVFNEDALDHYEKMIVALRARGLEPVVTLHHFVFPLWLAAQGGVLAPNFPATFARFSEKVVGRLAKPPARVRMWMTFNEPMVLLHLGYLEGQWPPARKGDATSTIEGAANLARAHIEATRRIRALAPEAQVSIAQHWRLFHGKGFLGPLLARLSDWVFNRQMVKALHTGRLSFWMPGGPWIRETIPLPENRSTLDFLGLNYYGRMMVSFTFKAPFVKVEEGPGPKSDLGWEIYPEGLTQVLKDADDYGLPILISENGIADAADSRRANFLRNHIASMNEARRAGVPVMGYLHWSLTDNFEWAFALEPRFGLVAVDYATGRLTKRPSFETYRALIKADRASPDPAR